MSGILSPVFWDSGILCPVFWEYWSGLPSPSPIKWLTGPHKRKVPYCGLSIGLAANRAGVQHSRAALGRGSLCYYTHAEPPPHRLLHLCDQCQSVERPKAEAAQHLLSHSVPGCSMPLLQWCLWLAWMWDAQIQILCVLSHIFLPYLHSPNIPTVLLPAPWPTSQLICHFPGDHGCSYLRKLLPPQVDE